MAFDSEGGKLFRMILPDQDISFQMIPNGLYYFDAVDQENDVLLINTVAENTKGFTQQGYEGIWRRGGKCTCSDFRPRGNFETWYVPKRSSTVL